jgi:thiamine-phosphate pyrophosphorylase
MTTTSVRSGTSSSRTDAVASRVVPVDPRKRLADARLYLCTDSRRLLGDLEEFLDAVLRAGVDVVQLREKGLEAREEIALLEVFATAAERHGALYAVNDRADVAAAVAAPILHLGQGDLPPDVARRMVGASTLIGLSSHDARQANAAATAANVDYFCAGPVWSTPTKPGRPAAGLEVVSAAAQVAPADAPDSRPWFAIGGIDLANVDDVIAQGAHGVVVVRAITEAEDPAAAAAAFVERLRAAG